MFAKVTKLTPTLYEYVLRYGSSFTQDDASQALIHGTEERYGDLAEKQIPPDVGALLTILARLARARFAVEVGTFTGYSAMCIARGLAKGGRLVCCDISREWTSFGEQYWRQAGLEQHIEVRIGPAIETLRRLPSDNEYIDLAFIDADKPNYVAYWNELVPRVRPGGVLIVDNVLKQGQVAEDPTADEHVIGIVMFNEHISVDARVEYAMLTVGDGITVAVKKAG